MGVVLLGGLACGDDPTAPSPPPPPPPPVATTVAVTPASASLSSIEETVQLSAEVRDQNGRAMSGASVAWASSDVAVATVDASGLAMAAGNGTATITATSGSATGSSTVSVEQSVQAVSVTPDTVALLVGDTARLSAAALDALGNEVAGAAFSWSSSDSAVVSVDGSGLVRGVTEGAAKITAAAGDAEGTSEVTVTNPDRAALVAFYMATDGPNWVSDKNWLTDTPLEDWYGVALNRDGRVESLSLGRNGLKGSIPAELGNLSKLTQLRLSRNELTGPMPRNLIGLEHLSHFHIGGNAGLCAPGTTEFSTWLRGIGELDWEVYCNESDAVVLESLYERAGGRDWVNSEGWLGGPALEEWNGVGADSLGRVSTLDLAGNGLSGELPGGLGLLAELTELRIGDNRALAGRLPVSLTRLSLSVLDYAGTNLCSPADASFRAWLAGVASHQGTGVECVPLGERDVLKVLYEETDGANWNVSDNWLTDAPLAAWHGVETDASGRIVSLELNYNGLAGSIPPELGGLTSLERLRLSGNSLFGPIPPKLGDLANLQLLDLSDSDLTGPIPPELAGLANLRFLDLSRNDLSGSIPSDLGDLASLWGLFLAHNNLSGPTPPELGRLGSLFQLTLAHNDLSGPIPPELGGLANLWELDLSNNDLSGPIPPELGEIASLFQLSLSYNDLSGPIPPELGEIANLGLLSLSYNDLSDPIPPELGGLANLKWLSLDYNNLSGSLPSELGRLAYLKELDLTRNIAMSGPLPSSMTNLGDLEALYARGTGLCAPGDDIGLQAWLAGLRDADLAVCAPAAAYLVQAVQSRAFPVPLVAGEKALLRVFPTAARESNANMPLVRARFHVNGTETHAVDIPATGVPIPMEIDEGDMTKSANVVIPAEVVRPGLEMVIEVDPDGTLDPTLGVAERIPATGRLAVEVREMPPFDLTVIPFLWASEPDSSVIGFAEDMASDADGHALLAATRTLLPVADIEVTAHAPVTTSSNFALHVLAETQAIRALEGGNGHHMGLMARFQYWSGVAEIPGRSSVSLPNGDVIAHELGHNINLRHAPCGDAGGPDPRYPYPDGSIGAWGYDFPGGYDVGRGGEPIGPWTDDVMGYCDPRWISDYHFTRALGFRLAEGVAPAAAAARSILVWGGVDAAGVPFLDPAFVVDAPPVLPDSVGDHTVVGRTTDGTELFSLDFAMPEVADADGSSAFAFVLPAEPGWAGALASLTLTGPGGEATLDGDTDRPMAILRDPRIGQVRGFLRDLAPGVAASDDPASALSSEPGLEALFSRGIPDPTAWRR